MYSGVICSELIVTSWSFHYKGDSCSCWAFSSSRRHDSSILYHSSFPTSWYLLLSPSMSHVPMIQRKYWCLSDTFLTWSSSHCPSSVFISQIGLYLNCWMNEKVSINSSGCLLRTRIKILKEWDSSRKHQYVHLVWFNGHKSFLQKNVFKDDLS